MKNILVTGGSGFFGRGFVREALKRGAERICVYSRGEYAQHLMRQEFENDERLRFFVGDVRDVGRLTHAMQGVDLVVHAAALKRVEVGEYDSGEMVKTNVLGAMNVIEAATIATYDSAYGSVPRPRKVVALSTDKACEPLNCYGASKLVAEKLFLAANNSRGSRGPIFAVCRYGNVSGSTGSVIPTWRRALEQGRMVTLTDPECTRYWMTLAQAVDLVLTTAQEMAGGELVIPELPAYRLGDLADAMGVFSSITGLTPGEKTHESMRPGETSEQARRMAVEELRNELELIQ